MSRFWLVQRVRYEDQARNRFWSDQPSNFSLEYMGSAEFEFGATADSLKRLLPLADKLVLERTVVHGASFDILRQPADSAAAGALADWIAVSLDSGRRGLTTKEWPYGLFTRLDGRLSATPPPGRGGKVHQAKVRAWELDWAASGVLYWDLLADFFFGFTPGSGPDGQPAAGVVPLFAAELRRVAAARRSPLSKLLRK
jgi:hypothetical protein